VPARAVLHEAGKLAQERRLDPAQAGFINAVLRRLAAGETPPWPDAAQDPALALSIAQAHPLWLAQRWLNRWGPEETTARLAANNAIPPLTIRVNTLKTDAARLADRLAQEGLEARPARFSPDGLILAHPEVSPAALPSYREGLWLFQDEAAQLAAMLAPLEPGQTVVELGAGRGGKTSHLAEMLKRQGKVLALDTHWGRLGDLARLMRRWGAAGVQPVRADAARALPLKPRWAHLAVVDAPCSALGIIRRHPEIKTRLTLADLASFPPRQRAMLTAAAGVVRPGGHILYITCTTEPEENEQVVADFLAARPDFALANAAAALPAAARGLVDPAGFFRTDPARHNLDGFFAALLAKIN
jgi:16S rRNA (cytosine967-C5)-methyltransferase